MLAFVVSDLHLGSPHCQAARILTFLAKVPDGATLILNGDILDRCDEKLPPDHQAVLDVLHAIGQRLELIVLEGNHDLLAKCDAAPGPMKQEHAIGQQLYIAHGHSFRLFRSYETGFLPLIKFLLRVAVWLGAPSVHPAAYGKRWPWLYLVLRRRLRANAICYAKAEGFSAVTCGHIHFAEDSEEQDVRYINTGCWTEATTHCLRIEDQTMTLLTNPDQLKSLTNLGSDLR